MKDKNLLIAVTGGIGSGKSTVMKILQSLSYRTISSDKIVSDLYKKRKTKKLLKALFPTAVTGRLNLKIDRQKIAQEVFSDKEKHQKLTALITPMVLDEIIAYHKKVGGVVFAEIPLLFECKFENAFDKVIVITREKEQRIASVITRSALSREEVEARMRAQFDYDSADLSKYVVIENNGNVAELEEKIRSII